MKGVYVTDMMAAFKYLTVTKKRNGNIFSISTVY